MDKRARHESAFLQIEDDFRRGLASVPFGGAALAVVAGDKTHIVVAGEALKDEPVTPATPFHICSGSKTFTAAVFSQLVAEGSVSWDDRTRLKIPEFAFTDTWVTEHCTYRDLAAMRVGLTRAGIAEWGFRQNAPKAERLRRARHMALTAPFRDRFSYSNLCYIALALAAERIAGEPYPDLLQRLVCAPLGLRDTWSGGFDVAQKSRPVQPVLPINEKLTAVDELTGPNSEGSARVYLSARDAVVWMQCLLSTALTSTAAGRMASPQSIIRESDVQVSPDGNSAAYGYGLFITQFLGKPLLRHGGGGRGLRYAMALAPCDGVGVTLMVSSESAGIDGLALDILERLVSGESRDWSARFAVCTRASAAEERRSVERQFPVDARAHSSVDFHEGTFRNDVTGTVRLTKESGRLRFVPVDAPIFEASLQRLSGNLYELEFDNPALTRQALDRLFRVKFQAGAGGNKLEASYFGELRELP